MLLLLNAILALQLLLIGGAHPELLHGAVLANAGSDQGRFATIAPRFTLLWLTFPDSLEHTLDLINIVSFHLLQVLGMAHHRPRVIGKAQSVLCRFIHIDTLSDLLFLLIGPRVRNSGLKPRQISRMDRPIDLCPNIMTFIFVEEDLGDAVLLSLLRLGLLAARVELVPLPDRLGWLGRRGFPQFPNI